MVLHLAKDHQPTRSKQRPALGFAFLETPQRQAGYRGDEDIGVPPFLDKPNPHIANQMNYNF